MPESLPEAEVFGPSVKQALKVLAAVFCVCAAGLLLAGLGVWPDKSAVLILTSAISATLVGVTIFMVLSLVKGQPRITLRPDQLEVSSLVRTRRWQWEEIGPFSAGKDPLIPQMPTAVCAYSARNQGLLAGISDYPSPDLATADVRIPVAMIVNGLSREPVMAFAERLNAWRESHGHPISMEGTIAAPEEASELVDKLRKKQTRTVWTARIVRLAIVIFIIFLLLPRPDKHSKEEVPLEKTRQLTLVTIPQGPRA